MSRSGCSDDGDHINLWRGTVASAIRGRRGQAFLRELAAALDAMPEQRLIEGDLIRDGEVCAMGAVGVRRGVDLAKLYPDDYEHIAHVFGIAWPLVQEIEWINDDYWRDETPEQRWTRVREWVRKNIREAPK